MTFHNSSSFFDPNSELPNEKQIEDISFYQSNRYKSSPESYLLMRRVERLISGYLRAKTNVSESKDYHKFSTVYLLKTFFSAIPALTLPVIIVGGIVGGIFTPTEAASVAVITGLFTGII